MPLEQLYVPVPVVAARQAMAALSAAEKALSERPGTKRERDWLVWLYARLLTVLPEHER